MTSEASPGCEVVRRDRLIAVSGQADLDSFGQVAHPADPRAQVAAVVGRIRERLERVGAELSDLTKLVVFHVPVPGRGEREIRDLLARALGSDVLTTLNMVPLPRLVSPGILIAVDAYAMRSPDGRRTERAPLDVPGLASLPESFCHGLRCEEFVFTSGQSALDERGEVLFGGDLPSQNRHALDGVAAILDGLGVGPGDIVKFSTWRAPPPSPEDRKHKASIAMVGSIGPVVVVVVGFEIGTRADESRSRWCDFAPANRMACREGAGERRAREARRNGAVAHRRAGAGSEPHAVLRSEEVDSVEIGNHVNQLAGGE